MQRQQRQRRQREQRQRGQREQRWRQRQQRQERAGNEADADAEVLQVGSILPQRFSASINLVREELCSCKQNPQSFAAPLQLAVKDSIHPSKSGDGRQLRVRIACSKSKLLSASESRPRRRRPRKRHFHLPLPEQLRPDGAAHQGGVQRGLGRQSAWRC